MSAGFGFGALLRATEDRLRADLGLSEAPLPQDLVELTGAFRGVPARLTSRALRGTTVRFARFVHLEGGGGLEIANALCFGVGETPILGVDLVATGREQAVVVLDLAPTSSSADVRRAQAEVVDRHRRDVPAPSVERPAEWARGWLSEDALVMRPTLARRDDVAAPLEAFTAAFVELSRRFAAFAATEGAPEDAARRAQAAYCDAHRRSDRGHLLLRRAFAPDVADRFVRYVLFPERLPS